MHDIVKPQCKVFDILRAKIKKENQPVQHKLFKLYKDLPSFPKTIYCDVLLLHYRFFEMHLLGSFAFYKLLHVTALHLSNGKHSKWGKATRETEIIVERQTISTIRDRKCELNVVARRRRVGSETVPGFCLPLASSSLVARWNASFAECWKKKIALEFKGFLSLLP